MRASLCACLSILTLACATTPQPPPAPRNPELADELLADTGTTALDLILDLDAYFGEGEEARRPAEIAMGRTRAAIEVDRVGVSSLLLCRWRKLRLRFGESPKKRLYLTPHCNDTDTAAMGSLQSEEQLYGQALAYRLLKVVEVPAMDTRLVQVRWIDRDDRADVRVRPAILIEDVADVARTMVGDENGYQGPGRDGPLTSLTGFDPAEVARFHLFQTMINNRDWRAFHLEPLGRTLIAHTASPLHNVFALDPRAGRPVLVPLDLDASSFAALPRTVADVTGGADETLLGLLAQPDFLPEETPLMRWMVLRVQAFRQAHAPRVADAAIASFVARRKELEETVRAFEAVLPEALRAPVHARATAHLEAFFRAVASPLWDWPVVASEGTKLFADATGDAVACADLPRGTPLILGETRGGRTAVRLAIKLRLGDGAPRVLCPGSDGNTVSGWLDARAISAQGRRR